MIEAPALLALHEVNVDAHEQETREVGDAVTRERERQLHGEARAPLLGAGVFALIAAALAIGGSAPAARVPVGLCQALATAAIWATWAKLGEPRSRPQPQPLVGSCLALYLALTLTCAFIDPGSLRWGFVAKLGVLVALLQSLQAARAHHRWVQTSTPD